MSSARPRSPPLRTATDHKGRHLTMYQQMIFVNLATNDVAASKKFFTDL
jgi:hypothetical protein